MRRRGMGGPGGLWRRGGHWGSFRGVGCRLQGGEQFRADHAHDHDLAIRHFDQAPELRIGRAIGVAAIGIGSARMHRAHRRLLARGLAARGSAAWRLGTRGACAWGNGGRHRGRGHTRGGRSGGRRGRGHRRGGYGNRGWCRRGWCRGGGRCLNCCGGGCGCPVADRLTIGTKAGHPCHLPTESGAQEHAAPAIDIFAARKISRRHFRRPLGRLRQHWSG